MLITARQRDALMLRKQGYTDAQAAKLMRLKSREAVNRLISRANRRISELRLACAVAGGDCKVIDALLN